jgi:hypothetical protein
MEVDMAPYRTPESPADELTPTCPLCATLDHVARPMTRYLTLRDDLLTTSWHCDHCQASYTFPEPLGDRPVRFGESLLT